MSNIVTKYFRILLSEFCTDVFSKQKLLVFCVVDIDIRSKKW